MTIGAAEVTSGKTIRTEFCIIGAGPAGLVVAAELSRHGHDVVVLESGAAPGQPDAAQELNEGHAVGHAYAGLRATRHRGIGGTTLLWNSAVGNRPGAKYVPLDPIDLEGRWDDAPDGWPITWSALEPWIRRAEVVCGVGSFADESALASPAASVAGRLRDGRIEPRLYQLAPRDVLIDPLIAHIRAAPNVRLIADATALEVAERDDEIAVRVASGSGARWSVRAARVVIAAGAIENARLLMVSSNSRGWPGDRSSWLGCGFMEHPRDRNIALRPRSTAEYNALHFFDTVTVAPKSTSAGARPSAAANLGRIGLTRAAIESGNLLNASATLLPNVQPARERIREVIVRRTGIHSFRRWLPESGHGWSRHPSPASVFAGFTVLLNVEQPPRRENRIRLSERSDRFGMPLPELTWHWHADDDARLARVRELFRSALADAGLGEVSMGNAGRPDPNAHHHAGTTRMHDDEREGVVDANGRVHGTNAMFVAGASVFPTAGFANPTLTIVAMAIRLANHLHESR